MEVPVNWRVISFHLLGFLLVISKSEVIFGESSDVSVEIPVHEKVNSKNNVFDTLSKLTVPEAAVKKRLEFDLLREKRSIRLSFIEDLFPIYPSYNHTNYTGNEKIPRIANNLFGLYDKVFAIILGFLFGLALDIDSAKILINGPGPAIAFFCKFIFAPFVRCVCFI